MAASRWAPNHNIGPSPLRTRVLLRRGLLPCCRCHSKLGRPLAVFFLAISACSSIIATGTYPSRHSSTGEQAVVYTAAPLDSRRVPVNFPHRKAMSSNLIHMPSLLTWSRNRLSCSSSRRHLLGSTTIITRLNRGPLIPTMFHLTWLLWVRPLTSAWDEHLNSQTIWV